MTAPRVPPLWFAHVLGSWGTASAEPAHFPERKDPLWAELSVEQGSTHLTLATFDWGSAATPFHSFTGSKGREDGPTVFAHACKMGLEGIVSKRKGSA